MAEIETALAGTGVFGVLSADHLAAVTACARTVSFGSDEVLFRAGGPADAVYVLTSGRVSLQLEPAAGAPLLIKTVAPGDVLGVSWMLPPYRWTLDAIATAPTGAVRIDSACLRDACDADPGLGHVLHRGFAGLVRERLVSTRLQLLDVYRDHVG